jgi:hypothetical protein
MTTRAMLILSVLGMAAVVAAPAAARDAKANHNTAVERAAPVERMPAMVAEPGEKATAPVGPGFVGRAYWDAARHDFDRQMNRGL